VQTAGDPLWVASWIRMPTADMYFLVNIPPACTRPQFRPRGVPNNGPLTHEVGNSLHLDQNALWVRYCQSFVKEIQAINASWNLESPGRLRINYQTRGAPVWQRSHYVHWSRPRNRGGVVPRFLRPQQGQKRACGDGEVGKEEPTARERISCIGCMERRRDPRRFYKPSTSKRTRIQREM